MTKEDAAFKALQEQYLSWKSSQENQTNGYEYERSFVEFSRKMSETLFNLSVEDENVQKKSSDDNRDDIS
jgi:hypothetical protein